MTANANAALPDPQTAYDTLFQGVHSRVFFQKCAAAGFEPRSPEEAQWMLNAAGKLRMISEHDQVKAAAAQDNPYFQMDAGLDRVMSQYGLGQNKEASYLNADYGYKQAAEHLMQDPAFYNSVLSLKAAEADQMRMEFDAWNKQNV